MSESKDMLSILKELRDLSSSISASATEDIKNFLNTNNNLSFRWLPNREHSSEIGMATTCTALMCLSICNITKDVYGPDYKEKVTNVIKLLMDDKWDSSGLSSDNRFNSVLFLRTVSELKVSNLLSQEEIDQLIKTKGDHYSEKTLLEICQLISKDEINTFGINEYPPHPAVGYWFLDAICKLGYDKEMDDFWIKFADWSTEVFLRQMSLIHSNDHSMMDPISMAMAACSLAKIRAFPRGTQQTQETLLNKTPTYQELRYGIQKFFDMQRDSGIWDKYFPLFHYPTSGANYCWCFEVMEAILFEFPDIVESDCILKTIHKSLNWILDHKMRYFEKEISYEGWNSGGAIKTLQQGLPELWATAVVYMFLSRLTPNLTNSIQKFILKKYNARIVHSPNDLLWKNLIDSNLNIRNVDMSLKDILKRNFITPINNKDYSNQKRSAFLFGPPGTAKTTIVSALALAIGWHILELSPSNFLVDGLENIYVKSNEIFEDLYELKNVVVLFDEVDSLGQNREPDGNGERKPSLTEQFLTTSMLPKLAKLYNTGSIIFFLATNHRKNFDDAIIRPGRFDMWLFIGPTQFELKMSELNKFIGQPIDDNANSLLEVIKESVAIQPSAKQVIDRMTFAEFKAFIKDALSKHRLSAYDVKNFLSEVIEAQQYLTLKDESQQYQEYIQDKGYSRIF